MSTNVSQVRERIKEIIANVVGLDPATIADDASFVEDLEMDSLSLLEVGVDMDYEFRLGVPEEELQQLRTVQQAVDLVLAKRSEAAA